MSTNIEFITKFTEILGDDFFLSDMIHPIKEFVDLNCTIEDDESEEDLYNDLILKVF